MASKTNVLLIYNAHLVDEAIDTSGAVLVIGDKIRAVYTGYFTNKKTLAALVESVLAEDGYGDCEIIYHDARGLVVMPAFIDMHTHLRYPGLTQKEDLQSGLSAAVAGGYGTVVAMPNTKPVISSYAQALAVEEEASKLGLANMFQSVSITRDFGGTDVSHLENISREQVPVITEDGNDVASASVMLEGMTLAAERGVIVSCHSEDVTLAKAAKPLREQALALMRQYHLSAWGAGDDTEDLPHEVVENIEDFLTEANGLLALAENIATMRNIEIARLAGCHVHLAHVSTQASIEAVRSAKADLKEDDDADAEDDAFNAYDEFELHGEYANANTLEIIREENDYFKNDFRVTCEVTPHHLALVGTDGEFLRALVNPPLRSEEDRLAIIEAIRDGTVDVISTDHAPHTAEDKANGSPGFVGLETAFGVCYSVLVYGGQISLQKLSQLMSANAAKLLQLNKGKLCAGFDADIVIVDTDEKWVVDSAYFKSKGRATPFEGVTLTGKVKATFVGGKNVYSEIN